VPSLQDPTVLEHAGAQAPPTTPATRIKRQRPGRDYSRWMRGGGSKTVGDRGVLVFSAQDYWYHNRAHSDVQLARALSATGPVLLVNSIGMRMPTRSNTTEPLRRITRKLGSIARTVRRPEAAHPALYVLSPISVPLFGHPVGRRFNAALVALQVRLVSAAIGIGSRPDVVITLPTAWDVARRLKKHAVIVNRSDKYSALPEADNALIESMEHQMLAACDAAVYVNHGLLADESELVQRGRALYLGHGVDFDFFSAGSMAPVPSDIASVPRPRIGFFGGIDDYVVDIALIAELAKRCPELQIVLIGSATCPIDDLTSLPNVTWLGQRGYDQIPAYGAAFDVAIMPWLRNEWIERCNPIKAKEYLALGLPVVTTSYPEAAWLEDVMDIAPDSDSFVELVQAAVRSGGKSTPDERRDRVRDDSWQSRASAIREIAAQVH
jgi:glycosyltransferase involved in cell wall biosynthesis